MPPPAAPPMTHLKAEPADKLYFTKQSQEKVILKLTNQEAKNVAYKLKTTAPKSYVLRPKEGVLKPGASEEIAIVLVKAGMDGAHNQRFQLTAMLTSSSEALTKEQWEDGKDTGEIQEHRLSALLDGEQEKPTNKPFVSSKALGEIPQTIPEHPGQAQSDPKQAKHDQLLRFVKGLEDEKEKAEKEKKLFGSAAGSSPASLAADLTSLGADPAAKPVAGLTALAVLLSILARRRNGTSAWKAFFRDLIVSTLVVAAYGAGRHGPALK